MHDNFDIRKAAKLDNPDRLAELRPHEIYTSIAGITSGLTCVDLGSGTGTFSLPLAEVVGKSGLVYAVDRSPEMQNHLIARNPTPNIIPMESSVEDTGLPDGVANFCLMAFILHELSEPEKLAAEAFRLLEPGGLTVAVEWRHELEKPGPPRIRRLSRQRITDMLETAGFEEVKYIEWSPYHYLTTAYKMVR
ncbi:class I SAM-dependent methyltransferase [Chloroflexota bacterium]